MLETLARLFEPMTLTYMMLAILLVAIFQNGFANVGRSLIALGRLFTSNPEKERDEARVAVRQIDEMSKQKGLACIDRVRTANSYMSEASRKLSNCDNVEIFEFWANQTLSDRGQRHSAVHKMWLSVADAAPALGLAGTIIGMVAMFAGMDDPASLGPAMSVALLTTFYGVVIANLIAAPIAARLSDLSERELAWQREMVEQMSVIARRETALLRRASIREISFA